MAGFTMIETMVVVAIVAILAALAAPSFISLTQKYRIMGEANALIGDIQFARAEAIREGQPVTICTSSNGTACSGSTSWQGGWIVFSDPNGNRTVDANETVYRQQSTWTNTDTATSAVATSSVMFSRDGFVINGNVQGNNWVTFTLHSTPVNAYATACVTLNSIGRVLFVPGGTGGCQ